MNICPSCNSDALIKRGKCTTTGKQRYSCKECKKITLNPLDAPKAPAEGYNVTGQSILYDEAGNVKLRWEKVNRDKEKQFEMVKEAAKEMSRSVKRAKPFSVVPNGDASLLSLYTFTDYHLGMMAWHQEGGANWNINLAEQTAISAFAYMMQGAPNSKIGVINNLGDFLHFDGILPVTPTSGHVLDSDSRYKKLVRVAIRIIKQLVQMAIEKHSQVILINSQGNHDLSSSIWLQELFYSHYEHEPRVHVDVSALPFYCIQHGKTLLAFHHGHKVRFDSIGAKIPAEFPKEWGATDYRYVHTGHLHHKKVKEDNGITTEQHQTLSARDAHASYGSYHAERATTCITYSDEYGEVARITVKPEMIKAAA